MFLRSCIIIGHNETYTHALLTVAAILNELMNLGGFPFVAAIILQCVSEQYIYFYICDAFVASLISHTHHRVVFRVHWLLS